MLKYLEVASYYVHQHPLMFIVLALCVIAIALMFFEASRQFKRDIVNMPDYDNDKENE